MPTQLPTKTVCLNCDYEVKTENRYCPNCGQENADKRISLLLLLQDAISTVFNFESRVFKTIPYFLFYPGRLTNEFLAGKRVRYMHPFKIYLLSSLLFFFVIIKLLTPALEDSLRKIDTTSEQLNLELSLDDSVHISNKENNSDTIDSVQTDSKSAQLTEKFQQRKVILRDSISEILVQIKNGKINDSTINIDSLEILIQDSTVLAETMHLFNEKAKEKNNGIRSFIRLMQNRKTTPEKLLEALHTENRGSIYIYFAEQLLKIGRNDSAIFLTNIINNIGTIMFFALPLLALCFMPFYLRRKKYYIDHLIFTLHLQAFTFIALTLAAIFFHWVWWLGGIFMILGLIIYVWIAFKRVYKQSFFKTTIKASIISFLYAMILVFMLSINLMYSFIMF